MIIASSRNIPGDAAKIWFVGKKVIRCEFLRPCGRQSPGFAVVFIMVAEQLSVVPCFLCFVCPGLLDLRWGKHDSMFQNIDS